ncbi:hypothetical protein D9M71_500880 [compost metagenome]
MSAVPSRTWSTSCDGLPPSCIAGKKWKRMRPADSRLILSAQGCRNSRWVTESWGMKWCTLRVTTAGCGVAAVAARLLLMHSAARVVRRSFTVTVLFLVGSKVRVRPVAGRSLCWWAGGVGTIRCGGLCAVGAHKVREPLVADGGQPRRRARQ